MYKVIVVEDEDLIRKGLVYAMPWSEMGCTVVGEGRNGIEGVELIRQHDPDIVLADINMPVMDGLEMMRQTSRTYGYSAIILSGYSSFEYAKGAIQWGATNYLLKPVKREELVEAVEKAKEQREIRRTWQAHEQAMDQRKELHMELEPVNGEEPDEAVSAMLDYIRTHYREKISLQDVAGELNYSVAFLNHRFKKQMGTTLIEYLNRFRIQKALDLLREGKAPLRDISWMCGIGEYKYFSLVFRKYLGCSPKEYRSTVLGRLE